MTLDRSKVVRAQALLGLGSMSDAIDAALDRVIRAEELRRDVAAYTAIPPTADELAVGDLPVELDLGDGDVDYDVLYGDGP